MDDMNNYNPYGQSGGDPFGGQPVDNANPYGQPVEDANPYGQPVEDANPYGQPVDNVNPYGQPVDNANPYGQPVDNANPYGQPVDNTNPYGQPVGGDPYGQPVGGNSYGQPVGGNNYGQPVGGNPYGQPVGGDPYAPKPDPYGGDPYAPRPDNYGTSSYPPQQGYGQPNNGFAGIQPEDGKATGGLVCSILSLICLFVCGTGIILAPIGMVLSKKAIDAGNNGGKAKAGWIIGIIGLVFNILSVLFWVLIFVIAANE